MRSVLHQLPQRQCIELGMGLHCCFQGRTCGCQINFSDHEAEDFCHPAPACKQLRLLFKPDISIRSQGLMKWWFILFFFFGWPKISCVSDVQAWDLVVDKQQRSSKLWWKILICFEGLCNRKAFWSITNWIWLFRISDSPKPVCWGEMFPKHLSSKVGLNSQIEKRDTRSLNNRCDLNRKECKSLLVQHFTNNMWYRSVSLEYGLLVASCVSCWLAH